MRFVHTHVEVDLHCSGPLGELCDCVSLGRMLRKTRCYVVRCDIESSRPRVRLEVPASRLGNRVMSVRLSLVSGVRDVG